nr:hypothetical protein GCM10020093_084320 [Planobispora longispora]
MSAELKKLIADFGKLPKSMRAEIRASAKEIGDPVLQEVRRRASWSSRIPAATRISVRFGARTSGVTVRTSAKKAPHARPYEHGGERGTFRVPVFRQKGGARRGSTGPRARSSPRRDRRSGRSRRRLPTDRRARRPQERLALLTAATAAH